MIHFHNYVVNFVESCDIQGLSELFGTVHGPQGADVPADGHDATAEEERR